MAGVSGVYREQGPVRQRKEHQGGRTDQRLSHEPILPPSQTSPGQRWAAHGAFQKHAQLPLTLKRPYHPSLYMATQLWRFFSRPPATSSAQEWKNTVNVWKSELRGRTTSAGLKAPDTPQLRLMRHRAVPRIAISS